jgi:glycosyltransferase involved in cell wall biosynthesis
VTAGFFSPLPPAPTGVADYSAALLRAMRRYGQIRVNDPHTDAVLYHIGNNHLHRGIYDQALRCPGVVVLHDALLHHYFLGALKEPDYVAEFVYNYGGWSSQHARELWAHRGRSAADPEYFRYPMLRRICESAKAVVVHNPAAARIVREHARCALIHEIPHLWNCPPALDPVETARLRDRLGVTAATTLFAVFGHLRESKRLEPVLRAFAAVRRKVNAALLIAGDFVSDDYERTITPLLSGPGIVRIPALPEHEWWMHAHAADVCVNLRYPSAAETSGIAIRLMGIGKPVIMTAGQETLVFPEAACLRVDSGPCEEDMLAEFMFWLARSPGDARAIGELASRHIRENHDAGRVARMFWQVLREAARV